MRVNAVGPASIETPLLATMTETVRAGLVAQHPVGRLGQSEEVTEVVAFLSSAAALAVTGAHYPVDGGHLAR